MINNFLISYDYHRTNIALFEIKDAESHTMACPTNS